jgi:hypothetical protein
MTIDDFSDFSLSLNAMSVSGKHNTVVPSNPIEVLFQSISYFAVIADPIVRPIKPDLTNDAQHVALLLQKHSTLENRLT